MEKQKAYIPLVTHGKPGQRGQNGTYTACQKREVNPAPRARPPPVGVTKAEAEGTRAVGFQTPVAGDYPVSKAFGLGVTGSPRGILGNGRVDRPVSPRGFRGSTAGRPGARRVYNPTLGIPDEGSRSPVRKGGVVHNFQSLRSILFLSVVVGTFQYIYDASSRFPR